MSPSRHANTAHDSPAGRGCCLLGAGSSPDDAGLGSVPAAAAQPQHGGDARGTTLQASQPWKDCARGPDHEVAAKATRDFLGGASRGARCRLAYLKANSRLRLPLLRPQLQSQISCSCCCYSQSAHVERRRGWHRSSLLAYQERSFIYSLGCFSSAPFTAPGFRRRRHGLHQLQPAPGRLASALGSGKGVLFSQAGSVERGGSQYRCSPFWLFNPKFFRPQFYLYHNFNGP